MTPNKLGIYTAIMGQVRAEWYWVESLGLWTATYWRHDGSIALTTGVRGHARMPKHRGSVRGAARVVVGHLVTLALADGGAL